MSSIPASVDPAADRAIARRVRKALAAKERRELRPALWAGLTIFVGLPLLWSIFLILLDPKHRALPGVATLMGLGGGWIFAAITAAQTICRDFGRAPGVFLTGLPVSRGQIIEAKATASFQLVILLITLIAVLEFASVPFADPLPQNLDPNRYALFAAFLSIAAWFVAFVAAAITRNTLTAVVIAAVCLALAGATPLVSSWTIEWFVPLVLRSRDALELLPRWVYGEVYLPLRHDYWDWDVYPVIEQYVITIIATAVIVIVALLSFVRNRMRDVSQRHRTTFWRPVLLGAIFAVLCNSRAYIFAVSCAFLLALFVLPPIGEFLARVALRSDRGLKLSMRALVTGMAALLVGLFLLAMREVGANGRVAFTRWNSGSHSVSAGSQFAASALPLSYELVCTTPDGGFLPVVRGVLPGADAQSLALVVMGTDDKCYVLRSVSIGTKLGTIYSTPIRLDDRTLEMFSVNTSTGRAIGPVTLALPALPEYAVYAAFDALIDDESLFVLLLESCLPDESTNQFRSPKLRLAKYAIHDSEDAPRLTGSWDLETDGVYPTIGLRNPSAPSRCYFARGCDGRPYLVRYAVAAIALNDVQVDPIRDMRFRPTRSEDTWMVYYAANFPVSPSICAVSAQIGLRLIEEGIRGESIEAPTNKPAKLLGELRASPWAWLFRSQFPTLLAGRKNQLWEIHNKSAICYDVSDSTRPRRILHVQTYPITSAASGTEFLVLSHGAGFSIVKHPQ